MIGLYDLNHLCFPTFWMRCCNLRTRQGTTFLPVMATDTLAVGRLVFIVKTWFVRLFVLFALTAIHFSHLPTELELDTHPGIIYNGSGSLKFSGIFCLQRHHDCVVFRRRWYSSRFRSFLGIIVLGSVAEALESHLAFEGLVL